MSIRDDETGLEWAGALGPPRPVPHARQPDPAGVPADAHRDPALPPAGPGAAGPSRSAAEPSTTTLREFLAEGGFSAYFVRHFMEPVVAAVWSCDPDVALDYPARYLFTFLDHHGMLGVFGSPDLAHGHRRLAGVRPRVAAALDEVRVGVEGHLGARDRRRRRGHRRQRRRDDVRRRGHRHPPRSRADDAGRADGRPARGARRDAVLPQRRPAAHRHLAAAARPPMRGRRGTSCATAATATAPVHRDLRPDPAAAARHRDPLPRHPRRRAPRRPGAR